MQQLHTDRHAAVLSLAVGLGACSNTDLAQQLAMERSAARAELKQIWKTEIDVQEGRPSARAHEVLNALCDEIVVSREPPFHLGVWRFLRAGKPYMGNQTAKGYWAFIQPETGENLDMLEIRLRTDGDAADIYRRVTGQAHPELGGKLSRAYRVMIREAKVSDEALRNGRTVAR